MIPSWLLPGGIGAVVGGGAVRVFQWLYPSRKEWKEERRAKHEKEFDQRLMEAIESPELWNGPRPMTGSGDVAVRADELAKYLGADMEKTRESLERLENCNRLQNIGGHMADPTPRWHTTRRL
jgi:hypothetical protein